MTWLDQFAVKELKWSAKSRGFNPNQHFCTFWDELKHQLWTRSTYPTSVLDLTTTLLAEWAKISTDTLQNLLERLPRIVETVKDSVQLRINSHNFGMGCPTRAHIGVMVRCPK